MVVLVAAAVVMAVEAAMEDADAAANVLDLVSSAATTSRLDADQSVAELVDEVADSAGTNSATTVAGVAMAADTVDVLGALVVIAEVSRDALAVLLSPDNGATKLEVTSAGVNSASLPVVSRSSVDVVSDLV
jgi:hypothetical protein